MNFEDESGIYLCIFCDYKSNRKNSLKKHIVVKHQGLRFPCDQWHTAYGSFYFQALSPRVQIERLVDRDQVCAGHICDARHRAISNAYLND